ncbi:MAG: 4Fe-4S cluster-binding domain-containing protein [Lachnospiraceae bacterium]|nr:4Fe-4S cluster-binding domain-containing protein [Lachnospiraceae bacterium]
MKKGTRLYINITNHCNTECPFCCMYSGRDKNSFMDFDTFKGIIDECDGEFELQLEGGEPLTHKALFLFIEYAVNTGRCKKILILSNGILMKKFLKRIVEFANWNRILVELKLSINYWLIEQVTDFMEDMNRISFAAEDLEFVKIVFNVRKRKNVDEGIDELIEKYGLSGKSNIFYLQGYGRLAGTDLDPPVIVQNIENWRLYASDGKCFGTDLIGRSEWERGL